MRIRTIKPEFFEDEDLAELSPYARLLFIGTWLLADKNGVFEDRPRLIAAKIFPYSSGETPDVSRLLHELSQGGFILGYDVDGRKYYHIPGFAKHQRITGKEAQNDGRYPLPPKDLGKKKQKGNNGEAPEKQPGSQEREREREQGKGKEPPLTPPAGGVYSDSFEKWWKIYPRKIGKDAAYKKWKTIGKEGRVSADKIISAIEAQVKARHFRGRGTDQDKDFIPLPATWLNQGRWNDDVKPQVESHVQVEPEEFRGWLKDNYPNVDQDIPWSAVPVEVKTAFRNR